MKIIEINIIQFGKFKDRTFTFSNGFNVVRGDNESGKSTLLAFIKFALYGVGRKNPSVAVGERERAISWNTGIAAGSLTIEDVDGRRYRIERAGREGSKGAYADKARIIDLESGAEVFEGEIPGEHFLGINAGAYDSMCNIRQLETIAVGTDAVKGAIDNLLSSGDESTSVQAALKTLDAERRRLLHTNGRGGIVFDCEANLERLKNEHRTSIAFENECAKNSDELERVELSLRKARDEHRIAQKLCDLHDDVLRLGKFNKLRELEEENTELCARLQELDASAGFDASRATYERAAEMTGLADSLLRNRDAFVSAQNELEAAEASLNNVDLINSEGLSALLDEYGSARAAGAYYGAKAKKAKSSLVCAILFGALGICLGAFSAIVAFVMSNPSGAVTVGFITALSLVGASVFFKRFKSARSETQGFVKKLDGALDNVSAQSIEDAIESFSRSRSAIVQRKNALESAKFRLSVAGDNFEADKNRARATLDGLGVKYENGKEADVLTLEAQKIREYLSKRRELEQIIREKKAIYTSLKSELERFSEADIRARITPEIEEKIQNMPFEKLKTERDSALQRTNQLSQYKAGIERNLAASGQRRSSVEIFPEIEREAAVLRALKLRLDAVRLAMETINLASLELKSDVTPRIRERAQENLATVSAGKYTELFVDENMKLSVFASGATRPIESLSRGSLDAAYFALRLSLVQTLLADKKPPLCMDECLSQLDDGRAENTIRAIAEYSNDAQCILFTCQNRDVEIAKRVTDAQIIEL